MRIYLCQVTERLSMRLCFKPRSGHRRVHHRWLHLLPLLPPPWVQPGLSPSIPPVAQAAFRCQLTCGSLPLKLHCCFLSASALHGSWGMRERR